MADADPMFAAGVEGLMENNRDVDMVSSPRSPLLTSPCLKLKSSKSKRTLEESQKVSIRSRRRPARKKIASVPGSEATKLDFLPQMSCTVNVSTDSSIGLMECKSPENASESKALERVGVLCTEDSPVTTMDSTPLAKSSYRSGCAGKDPSQWDKSSVRAIEVCTPSLKRPSKRKRSLFQETLDAESKAAHVQQFQQEIASLVKYFNELVENNCYINASETTDVRSNITNAMIARLLEESRLPFSKLVQHIHEKLKDHSDKNGGETTLAFVRSSVLFIGQRSLYGILNADADVLEDESESCLWCWEVRDLKLLPKLQRDFVSIHRRCRKKIHDRITALSAMISALSSSGSEESSKIDLAKAEEMLAKADDEMSIRAIAADLLQKNNAQIMARQAKLKEKEAVKERERNDRKVDMEQKRLDRELKREKVQQEKERERLEREASKERARAQKEALNQEKELKRQQEEAEKERRRREKEEAEMKKQLAIQKQATIMDRFLHSKKDPPNTSQVGNAVVTGTTPSPSNENGHNAVMELMDNVLFQGLEERQCDGLLRSHLAAWHDVHHQISTQRPVGWGMRRKPKVPLFKELRLQGAPAEAEASGKVASITCKRRTCNDTEDVDEFKAEKLVNEWEEQALNDSPPGNNVIVNAHRDSRFHNKRRKLLQFDKSYRPAYYGTFSKKSDAVGPRHPFRKDTCLDYENDSDEEWEEEDPGESLSDCEKDEEEENIEAEKEKVKAEEDDDSEDGFFVPDGYLSENEGVCLDDMESDADEDLLEDLPAGKAFEGCVMNQQLESEHELRAFERQQKLLENATERALRSNHAFIVSNFFGDRTNMISESVAPGLSATHKLEQICLQALRIRVFSPDILIELPSESPTEPSLEEEQESCKRPKKNCTMLPDSDLPELVCVIQSSTQGMNKMVESLLKKFPHVAKRQLKNKIREISDFVDNQWKVKREVLEKLGMTCLPGEASEITKTPALQLKGIATFFSKRCLPPEVAGISVDDN